LQARTLGDRIVMAAAPDGLTMTNGQKTVGRTAFWSATASALHVVTRTQGVCVGAFDGAPVGALVGRLVGRGLLVGARLVVGNPVGAAVLNLRRAELEPRSTEGSESCWCGCAMSARSNSNSNRVDGRVHMMADVIVGDALTKTKTKKQQLINTAWLRPHWKLHAEERLFDADNVLWCFPARTEHLRIESKAMRCTSTSTACLTGEGRAATSSKSMTNANLSGTLGYLCPIYLGRFPV
jgi:hypothetical protein